MPKVNFFDSHTHSHAHTQSLQLHTVRKEKKDFVSFSRVDYSILFGAVYLIQHGVRIDFHQHRIFQFALNNFSINNPISVVILQK